MAGLPGLPPVVAELLWCDPRSDTFHANVLALVERQAALASRILSIANRVEPARSEPVLGLPQAVARVGTWRVARLIVQNVLLRCFPADSVAMRALWRHALLVATAAREIARASGRATHSHEAHVAGLLHDVGRFVLVDLDQAELARPEEEGWDSPALLLETERRLCGHDHAELGERICSAWSLPEDLARLVRLHHETPPLSAELPGRLLETLRILQQGDRLASLLIGRPRFRDLPPPERLSLLERACVHPAWDWMPAGPTQLDLLVDPILARSDERLAALSLVEPPEPSAPIPKRVDGD